MSDEEENNIEETPDETQKTIKDSTAVFESMSVPRAVFKLAIPAMIAVLFTMVYNLADTLFIGMAKENPDLQVNAVGLCTSLFMIFTTLGTLFGMGGSSLISRKMGQGDREYIKKVSSFCMWIGLASGVVVMILYLALMNPLMKMLAGSTLDESPELRGYMKDYLIMIAIAGPFAVVPSAFANIIRCEGKSTIAAAGMLGGNILNIALDPLFIIACDMGTRGAGLATLISMICATTYYIIYFLRGKTILSIKLKDFSGKNKITSQVLAIGIPAALGSLMISISTIILLNMMGDENVDAQTGMSIALKILMIATLLAGGIGQGVQSMLGYCVGANKWDRFNKTLIFSLGFAFVFCLILGILCFFFASPIAGWFLTGDGPIEYAAKFAQIMLFTSPFVGLFYVCQNTLLAMGSAVRSLIVNISRQGFVLIPLLFIMTAIWDRPESLAWAQVASDVISLVLAIVLLLTLFRSIRKKAERKMAQKQNDGQTDGDGDTEPEKDPFVDATDYDNATAEVAAKPAGGGGDTK